MSTIGEQLPVEEPVARAEATPFRRFFSSYLESKIATAALVALVVIIAIALIAPWISPQNPYDLAVVDVLDSRMPPGEQSFSGTTFWLGSDGAGRDMLSAIFYGLRISLGVGVASGVISNRSAAVIKTR